MIGGELTRYAADQKFLVFDIESNGLNLHYSLPWELSYAVFSLKNGIESIKTRLIKWPDLRISEELIYKVHFNRVKYEAEALDPKVVWDEFAPLLYSSEYRAAGHGLLAFDAYMIDVWRRLIGLPIDHSWIGGGSRKPLLDTVCLSKAYKKGWTPDVSSPDAFLSWQYRCSDYKEKGFKTKLGVMCAEFGISYNEREAHSAEYDVRCNALLLNGLIRKMEI